VFSSSSHSTWCGNFGIFNYFRQHKMKIGKITYKKIGLTSKHEKSIAISSTFSPPWTSQSTHNGLFWLSPIMFLSFIRCRRFFLRFIHPHTHIHTQSITFQMSGSDLENKKRKEWRHSSETESDTMIPTDTLDYITWDLLKHIQINTFLPNPSDMNNWNLWKSRTSDKFIHVCVCVSIWDCSKIISHIKICQ
jgi:hypothetical protein